jgi:hypothetical protein
MNNKKLAISKIILNRFKDLTYRPTNLKLTSDFHWIQTQSKLPWLKLDIDIPVEIISEEIKNVQHLLVPHRETDNEHSGWESFCIHGRGYNLTREDEFYVSPPDHHWTPEAIKFMPRTVDYFQTQWPGNCYSRVRVMKLAAGGYITVHSDTDQSSLTAINIAITQPDDCNFVMEKIGKVPFSTGSAFWLDLSNKHVVFNNSNQDRWHIILHQKTNYNKFQNLVVKSYNMLYNQTNETSNYYNSRRSQYQN